MRSDDELPWQSPQCMQCTSYFHSLCIARIEAYCKDRSITRATKIRLVSTLIFPIATYACETWVINAADQRRIEAFEMWCWRKLLCIPWTARWTNESIRHEIGERDPLFNMVVRHKLQYFGHTARREGENLEKDIMLVKLRGRGTEEGKD